MAGVNELPPDATPRPDPDATTPPAPAPLEDAPGEAAGDPLDSSAEDGSSVAMATQPDPRSTIRRQNRIAGFAAVGVAIVLAFGGGVAVGRLTADAGAGGQASPAVSAPAATGGADLPATGPLLGRSDAKVVIDYWADFQCPYCAKFARDTIPLLESRIADGTVALLHRDFAFIGAESEAAAVAVRCAGREDRFWPMHDAVYAAQQGENEGAFSRDRLLQIGASVGLDATSFEGCLDDPQPLVEVLDDTAAGIRAGVTSTPTIDVNGTRFLGVTDNAQFLATIDAAASGAAPGSLPTAPPSSDPWAGTPTDGRTAGAANAPVTVELWMDYQSTDSQPVVQSLEPELRTRIADGAVRAELHDVAVLDDDSVAAAGFVRCIADQGGPAWFVHDVLAVSAQGAGAGIFTTQNLLRLGSKLGLDVRAADACMADPATEAAVRAETADAAAAGITAGPTVIVRKGEDELGRFAAPIDAAAVLAVVDGAK
jgi:protein-disulfide isomerase